MSLAARLALAALALLAPLCATAAATATAAAVQRPAQARLLIADDSHPPAPERTWRPVRLPDSRPRVHAQQQPPASWYAVEFQAPAGAPAGPPWALYLPYLAEGGSIWLNGTWVGQIPQNTPALRVRWVRPHLVQLPGALLREGGNELMVRVGPAPPGTTARFPRPQLGLQTDLLPHFDSREFWIRVTPQITATVCMLGGAAALFIWWRRRAEVIYGLFGAAVLLWGLRTLTFVVEVMPPDAWLGWRLVYFGATGGFIVLLTFVAMRLAGVHAPRVEHVLVAYWLAGPLWLLAQGLPAEQTINRFWIAGFLPIGAALMGVSVWALWRTRTLESAALPAALVLGVLAGVHDYVVAWDLVPHTGWFGNWAAERVQLLHHGANLVLLAMGALLTARFVRTLGALEALNRTLEARVAQREADLADSYVKLFALERDQAASQERQRIMRELHDGLGSQLFVSLSRVERGDFQPPQMADALRDCIAEMRLALDTLGPGQQDFRATLGDFLFRWQRLLQEHGVHPAWSIDVPDQVLQVHPHAALQLLRVAQEALTNTLKHAQATEVQVRLRQTDDGLLELELRDNGRGAASPPGRGRGIGNMRARAEALRGRFDLHSDARGTRVTVQVPLRVVTA